MNLSELKIKYNSLVNSYKRVEIYLDDNNVPMAEREKKLPEFYGILNNITIVLGEIKNLNCEMTSEEILNGFK